MSQNREPPAFAEYSAHMLAQLHFRIAPLAARGFYTLRLECWTNKRLPRKPSDLAKYLGLPVDEVTEHLASIMPFFAIDGEFIYSPELENYRTHLAEIRAKQSKGGKRSSEVRNGKRKTSAGRMDKNASSTLASDLQVPTQVGCKSLIQPNTTQHNRNQSLSQANSHDVFVDDYESYESDSTDAYLKASRG